MKKKIEEVLIRTKLIKLKGNKQFLGRVSLVMFIVICIPIFILGVFYYRSILNMSILQIEKEYKTELDSIAQRAEIDFNRIEISSLTLSLNEQVSSSFTTNDTVETSLNNMKILHTMEQEKQVNNQIKDIFLYNEYTQRVISSDLGCIDLKDYHYQSIIKDLRNISRGSKWYRFPNGICVFIRELPQTSFTVQNGMLVYVIDLNEIANNWDDFLVFNKTGSISIFDSEQNLLILKGNEKWQNISNDNFGLNDMIIQTYGKNIYYKKNSQKIQTMYILRKVPKYSFVLTVSKNEAFKKIELIKTNTLLVAFIIILISICLTITSSRSIYNPIKKLFNYSIILRNENENSVKNNEIQTIKNCLDYFMEKANSEKNRIDRMTPIYVEHIINNILNNDYVDREKMYKDCEDFEIKTDGNYIVIVLQVEKNDQYNDEFSLQKKPILTFAVTNIIEELIWDKTKICGYLLSDSFDNFVIVKRYGNEDSIDEIITAAISFSKLVHQTILENLKIELSIGLGRIYSHIEDISTSYVEAKQALSGRLYNEDNIIFTIDEIEKLKKNEIFVYPFFTEKNIIDSIICIDIKRAENNLTEFHEIVKESKSYTTIQLSYGILLSDILNKLQENGVNIFDMTEGNPFWQMYRCKTSSEIYEWSIKTMLHICINKLNETHLKNSKSIINKVCKYIKDNDMSMISLAQCSEYVQLSPNYISRLFKQETGINFNEFVIKSKIEQTKILLLETDLNIKEIAKKIGYSERNLSRLFQRYANMTPGQYRQNKIMS